MERFRVELTPFSRSVKPAASIVARGKMCSETLSAAAHCDIAVELTVCTALQANFGNHQWQICRILESARHSHEATTMTKLRLPCYLVGWCGKTRLFSFEPTKKQGSTKYLHHVYADIVIKLVPQLDLVGNSRGYHFLSIPLIRDAAARTYQKINMLVGLQFR